jgi:hypothetical protein
MWLTRQRKNFAKSIIDLAIHDAITVARRNPHDRRAFDRLLRQPSAPTISVSADCDEAVDELPRRVWFWDTKSYQSGTLPRF